MLPRDRAQSPTAVVRQEPIDVDMLTDMCRRDDRRIRRQRVPERGADNLNLYWLNAVDSNRALLAKGVSELDGPQIRDELFGRAWFECTAGPDQRALDRLKRGSMIEGQ